MKYEMTPRQAEAYKAISDFIAANGYSPSVRELAPMIGVKSIGGVVRMINCLEHRGVIRRIPGTKRSLTITEVTPLNIDLEDPAVRTYLIKRGWTPPAAEGDFIKC